MNDHNKTTDNNNNVIPEYIQLTNEIWPRITGAITCSSAVYMILLAYSWRQWLFHNLVLGTYRDKFAWCIRYSVENFLTLSFFFLLLPYIFQAMLVHTFITGIFLLYGTAAISNPVTCQIQEFFLWFCSVSQSFYFASFSIYCYVCVVNNFERSKIVWVEKWIHLLVHLYPTATGIYILVINDSNFDSIGFCLPSYDWIDHVFTIIMFGVPLTVMSVLYCTVRQNQEHIPIPAKFIARQSVVYMGIMLWLYLPFLVPYFVAPDPTVSFFIRVYPYVVFAAMNYNLFGLWEVIAYKYFFGYVRWLFRRIAKEEKRIQQELELEQHRQQQHQHHDNNDSVDNSSSAASIIQSQFDPSEPTFIEEDPDDDVYEFGANITTDTIHIPSGGRIIDNIDEAEDSPNNHKIDNTNSRISEISC